MGTSFSRRAWTSRCYHSDRWSPSSRHLTPSLSTLPLPSSHRRLDKGSSLSVRKGDQGDAPLDVSSPPVGLNIPSSLRSFFFTSRLRYQRELILHLFPTLSRPCFPSLYLVLPAAGSAEGIQSEGKAGREIKT